jgi:hypothetical protein
MCGLKAKFHARNCPGFFFLRGYFMIVPAFVLH